MILYGRQIPKTGWLHLIYGCMFSGKTGSMIVTLNVLESGGHKVQLIRPTIDTRYHATDVTNHDGMRREAVVINPKDPDAILDAVAPDTTVVGIDEIQFFDSGIVGVVTLLSRVQGRVVVAAGLNTDFRQEPFGPMPDLMVRANTTESRYALCSECGRPATWTQRLVDGQPALIDDPIVVIGAKELYQARCGDCHEVRMR